MARLLIFHWRHAEACWPSGAGRCCAALLLLLLQGVGDVGEHRAELTLKAGQ